MSRREIPDHSPDIHRDEQTGLAVLTSDLSRKEQTVMSRREVFTSVAATPIAAIVALSPVGFDAEAQVEQELRAGIERMAVLRRKHDDAMARDDELKDIYYAGLPLRPAILRQSIRGMPSRGCEYEMVTENGRRFGVITRRSIQQFKTAPRYATGRCIDDDGDVIVHGEDRTPSSDKGKRAWAAEDRRAARQIGKVISAFDEWERSCDAWETACGYAASQEAYDAASGAYFDEMRRLLDLPAATIAAVALKARVLMDHDPGTEGEEGVHFRQFVAELAATVPSSLHV